MFSVESMMFFATGFLVAALSVLVVAPLIHARAVRLTRRDLESTIPISVEEIAAAKDALRAEFAMSTRRFETTIEQLRTKNGGQLVELGKTSKALSQIKTELDPLRERLLASEREVAAKTEALQTAERALSEKDLQLSRLAGDIERSKAQSQSQKVEIVALKTEVEVVKAQLATATSESDQLRKSRDAERDKLAEATAMLAEELERSNSQKIEIAALNADVEAVKAQLATAIRESDVLRQSCDAEREKLAEATAMLAEELERSNSQKIEIVALNAAVEAVKAQLATAIRESDILRQSRDAEREKLAEASQKFAEERARFETFHHRVSELVEQLKAQHAASELMNRRAHTLEKRLLAQAQAMRDRESELQRVQDELEAARSENNAQAQSLRIENAKLQAALQRANGERLRLSYELDKTARGSNTAANGGRPATLSIV
ncbi:MAG TPA: hypothetical protein VFP60_18235 [Pseudolabrys sp.]|nr:hypothetical protein [Pseudolabrys sp.]